MHTFVKAVVMQNTTTARALSMVPSRMVLYHPHRRNLIAERTACQTWLRWIIGPHDQQGADFLGIYTRAGKTLKIYQQVGTDMGTG